MTRLPNTGKVQFSLDDEAWNEWVDILNRPIVDKPRLADLFMRVAIFGEKVDDATAT